MSTVLLPGTSEIGGLFAEEISELGGTISDCFDDGLRLFLRAVIPVAQEVRRDDIVSGGVALRTDGEAVLVHPYTFREICRNGAIRAHAKETRTIHRVASESSGEEVASIFMAIREAVRACADPEAFRGATSELFASMLRTTEQAIELMPQLVSVGLDPTMIARIYDTFTQGGDLSSYGLMNAVTAVARDEPDPVLRWRLEELGGAVPARLSPEPLPGGASASLFDASAEPTGVS